MNAIRVNGSRLIGLNGRDDLLSTFEFRLNYVESFADEFIDRALHM